MRRKTPADDSAWSVHIEPDRPWLMALSIGSTSSPSTSPTITRSAFMRSDLRTRSATGILPSPSMFAGRASSATMSGCRFEPVSSPSSKACSMVTMRSRVDLGGEGAQQRGLAGVHRPGDHDVLPGPHGGGEKRSETRIHRPHGAQIGERQVGEPVPADGDRRPRGHGHERGQSGPARQLQVELRPGRVEPALGQPESARRRADQVDELLVGVGDGGHQPLGSIGEGRPHAVASVDIDVLDVGIVDQGLETPEPEQGIEDGLRQPLLVMGRQPADRRTVVGLGQRVQVEERALPGELLPVVTGEHAGLVSGKVFGHALTDVGGKDTQHGRRGRGYRCAGHGRHAGHCGPGRHVRRGRHAPTCRSAPRGPTVVTSPPEASSIEVGSSSVRPDLASRLTGSPRPTRSSGDFPGRPGFPGSDPSDQSARVQPSRPWHRGRGRVIHVTAFVGRVRRSIDRRPVGFEPVRQRDRHLSHCCP